MKATADQLAKIDWTKCKLSNWHNHAIRARQSGGDVHVEFAGISGWIARKPEGYEWRIATNGSTRAELDALYSICEQVDAFITSELAAIEARDLAEKRERKKPEPGDGFEYCSEEEATEWTCGAPWAYGFWCSRWVSIKTIPCDADRAEEAQFIFRRPKKVEPKLPTVKAPEGCWWESDPRYGMRLAWSESPGCTSYKYVPRDAAAAERGKAVNAAFDEANGSRFVQIEERVRETTTHRPIHHPPPAWVHHVKLGNGIEFDVGEPHRFKCGSRVRITIEELPETPKPA